MMDIIYQCKEYPGSKDNGLTCSVSIPWISSSMVGKMEMLHKMPISKFDMKFPIQVGIALARTEDSRHDV